MLLLIVDDLDVLPMNCASKDILSPVYVFSVVVYGYFTCSCELLPV